MKKSSDIVTRTNEAFAKVITGSKKVGDLVGEIAAASNEQAQGVSQITQGLGQVDQVTQQNTAHAEESASTAEELSSQAQMLQNLVAAFTIEQDMPGHRAETVTGNRQAQMMLARGEAMGAGGRQTHAPWGGVTEANLEPEPVIPFGERDFGN